MSGLIASNKKAQRDYHFLERTECGIVLSGSEVKSLRAGEVNFKDSYARIQKQEVYLYNLHINPYLQAGPMQGEPDRVRKLLLHKKQIEKLSGALVQKNVVLIPTKIYFNAKGLAKVEVALGKGKKLYDKREAIKKRDIDRAINRTIRNRR